MREKPSSFLLPDAASVTAVVEFLNDRTDLGGNAPSRVVRRYYDTFDARLFKKGYILSGDRRGRSWDRMLTDLAEVVLIASETPSDSEPSSPSLSTGPLQSFLDPITAPRALLPLLQLEHEIRRLSLLDKEQKIVVRLTLEMPGRILDLRDNTFHPLPGRVTIEPLKGYYKSATKLRKALEKILPIQEASVSGFMLALQSAGRRPVEYTSKPTLQLAPRQPAAEALRVVLQQLFMTMEANEAGIISGHDTEYLHDFRVAVRRTRSLMGQLKRVLPVDAITRFQQAFKWLGDLTGPTRDLDVFLIWMEKYDRLLASGPDEALLPMKAFIAGKQKDAQKALVSHLTSVRYTRFKEDWRIFLTTPWTTAPDADRPVLQVVSAKIWKLYGKARKAGTGLKPSSKAAAFHRLRIICKKLRYLMELFRSLYQEEEISRLITNLKGLQDNLGDYNDCDFQQLTLTRYAEEMRANATLPPETEYALDWLVADLLERQQTTRTAFAKRFTLFAGKENRRLVKALFHPSRMP